MARARNRNKSSSEGQTNQTERRGTMAFEALTDEALAQVLQGSRSRGTYDAALKEFIEGGERGVKVPLDSGTFEGKKAQSVKTGFTGAIGRDGAPEEASHVRVIAQGENVYLVRDDIES